MAIPFYEAALHKNVEFNFTNFNDEKLKHLKLEPLTMYVKPQFITPDGEMYYYTRDHHNADFKREYKSSLEAIEKTSERDYVLKTERFYSKDPSAYLVDSFIQQLFVYKGEAVFDYSELLVYEVLKYIPDINQILKEHFGGDILIPQLSSDEILRSKKLHDIFDHDYKNLKRGYMKIMASEYLKTLKDRLTKDYYRISTPNDITLGDVCDYINYNANVFMNGRCDFYFKGVYTKDVLDIIRGLISSKIAVYNYFINFLERTSNPLEAFGELNKQLIVSDPFLDMIVMGVGFDKIETQLSRAITTSRVNIHKDLFNYIIKDFNIYQLPKIIFNEATNKFEIIYPNDFIETGEEREYEREATLIKRKVPYKDRDKYFL